MYHYLSEAESFSIANGIYALSDDNYWFFTVLQNKLHLYGVKTPNDLVTKSHNLTPDYKYAVPQNGHGFHKIRQYDSSVVMYLKTYKQSPYTLLYTKLEYSIKNNTITSDTFQIGNNFLYPEFHPTQNALIGVVVDGQHYLKNFDNSSQIQDSDVDNIKNHKIVSRGNTVYYFVVYQKSKKIKLRRIDEEWGDYLIEQDQYDTISLNDYNNQSYSINMQCSQKEEKCLIYPGYSSQKTTLTLIDFDLDVVNKIQGNFDSVFFKNNGQILVSQHNKILSIWSANLSQKVSEYNINKENNWNNEKKYNNVKLWNFEKQRVVIEDNNHIQILQPDLSNYVSFTDNYGISEIYPNSKGYINYIRDDKFFINKLEEAIQLPFGIIVSVTIFIAFLIIICCCRYWRNRRSHVDFERRNSHNHDHEEEFEHYSQYDFKFMHESDIKIQDIKQKACAICLSTQCTHSLPCKHVFHKECISSWFKKNRICPNCRRKTNIKFLRQL